MRRTTRRTYAVVWLEDDDQCIDKFSTRRKMRQWLAVLRTRIMCGDKVEILAFTGE